MHYKHQFLALSADFILFQIAMEKSENTETTLPMLGKQPLYVMFDEKMKKLEGMKTPTSALAKNCLDWLVDVCKKFPQVMQHQREFYNHIYSTVYGMV